MCTLLELPPLDVEDVQVRPFSIPAEEISAKTLGCVVLAVSKSFAGGARGQQRERDDDGPAQRFGLSRPASGRERAPSVRGQASPTIQKVRPRPTVPPRPRTTSP